LGRPVKDWDIFVPADIWAPTIRERVGVSPRQAFYGAEYFDWSRDVVGSAEFEVDGEIINVVTLAQHITLEENLERFDWGMCRVGLNENGYVTYGSGYLPDTRQTAFILRRCENAYQFKRSMERYERLSKKYHGWTLLIPGEFTKLVDHYPERREVEEFDDFDDIAFP